MLQVEKLSVYGLEEAIRGMRNPMNSWGKSDSETITHTDTDAGGHELSWKYYHIGEADFGLMKRLCDAGEEHRKWMRMVVVYVDIIAPLYWWKEFDTYKVGTVTNSCSTMHTIHTKEFVREDFSHEHMNVYSLNILATTIERLNSFRKVYLHGGMSYDENHKYVLFEPKSKYIWWQMIQLLPSSYNQRRTVMLNLEVCYKLCKQREGHKLDEWKTLLDFLRDRVVMLDGLTK